MIVSIETVMALPEFSGSAESVVQRKMDAVENLIRAYTNNNFQVRDVRFFASSSDGVLNGTHEHLTVGDTVQITESGINDGLYTVEAVEDGATTLDRSIFDNPYNLVTLVRYPADVQMGALNMLTWEAENRSKVGVQSETISRHSVTFFDQSAANTSMGYPVSLLGFLRPYKKART